MLYYIRYRLLMYVTLYHWYRTVCCLHSVLPFDFPVLLLVLNGTDHVIELKTDAVMLCYFS